MEDISRDLIEQAQAGNIEAFERIYRASSGFVYSVALRITNSRPEAQEVTQDVFIKIYHNLGNFEFRSSFKTWAYRITVNTALNACKKISKEANRRQDFDGGIDTQIAGVDARKETVEQDDREQAQAKLDVLLRSLNPDQRACIVLREIEGLSYEEIARTLRININTVRSRLKRARLALMAQTGASGGE
ncbi:MAG: RNA polymerase sigma factor [Candidatus Omnitrophota bacterium]